VSIAQKDAETPKRHSDPTEVNAGRCGHIEACQNKAHESEDEKD